MVRALALALVLGAKPKPLIGALPSRACVEAHAFAWSPTQPGRLRIEFLRFSISSVLRALTCHFTSNARFCNHSKSMYHGAMPSPAGNRRSTLNVRTSA